MAVARAATGLGAERYGRYRSASETDRYGFLYPADWKLREVGSGCGEVFIGGPRNKAGTYTVSLAVRVSEAGGKTEAEAAQDFLASYGRAFGAQETGRAEGMVAGCPAAEVEVAYSMPLPLKSVQPQRTAIRERSVFFRRGERLYELVYAATEDDYEAWRPAFRTLVQTFTLEEEVAGAGFRPLVAPAADGPA